MKRCKSCTVKGTWNTWNSRAVRECKVIEKMQLFIIYGNTTIFGECLNEANSLNKRYEYMMIDVRFIPRRCHWCSMSPSYVAADGGEGKGPGKRGPTAARWRLRQEGSTHGVSLLQRVIQQQKPKRPTEIIICVFHVFWEECSLRALKCVSYENNFLQRWLWTWFPVYAHEWEMGGGAPPAAASARCAAIHYKQPD